ncbi:MAG: effector-associated domain EAD1-containing protein [Vicinamibacterales bacterium]
MILSGPQEAQLHAALVKAFPNRFAVEQLFRYGLNENLNAVVGDVGLNEVVFRVIEWAKTGDRIGSLIEKARLQNPENAALKEFVDELSVACPDPVIAADRPERAQTAARGLQTLERLMQNPDVREAVADFQADFEGAAKQIEVLAFYKDMHDLLHTLQFQCYRGITQEAKRFPDDATSREILADHEITFDGLVRQLDDVALRGVAQEAELIWLRDLREAHAEFLKAIQTDAVKSLTRAIWLMDRVLAVQPSQINTRLNAAARALRLEAIVDALTLLLNRFTGGGLDPAKVQTFSESIRSLEALQQNLTALVLEHDRWQALDLDLRRIQQNLKIDTLELELSWERVHIMIVPLCGADEPWAKALTATCDMVGQSLSAADATKQRMAFQRLYAQAAERFYRVDTTLKRMCESLRAIGDPLNTLLGLIK